MHPSQWVHQSCLGVDGYSQNGYWDTCVWVCHGDTQLQSLARSEASEPSVGQRLV